MDYLKIFKESRGITDSQYNNIINATCSYSFTKFKDEDRFVLLLNQARNKKILIIPDYDADGIMAGSIAQAGLSLLGFNSSLYYPNMKYGYGLTVDSLHEALSLNPGSEVIITCDNGITANVGIAEAKRLGMTVLVTDHHPQQGQLPEADVVVDPSRDDDPYPFKGICGAQVIYHLLTTYASLTAPEKYEDILNLGLLAGVASIGDSMPMLEENRGLVRASLTFLDSLSDESMLTYDVYPVGYRNAMNGMIHLKQKLLSENKYRAFDEDTYGFYICPMLNAPRRVMGDSKLAFSVFEGAPQNTNALYEINEERKDTTATLFDLVKEQIDVVSPFYFRTTPVILGASGYAGLVAGRLTELTMKPSICFSVPSDEIGIPADLSAIIATPESVISGSGRAPAWYSITDFLSKWQAANPDCGLKFGGHHQACGVSISAFALPKFSADFTRDIEEAYQIYVADLPDEILKDADINFSIGKEVADAIPLTQVSDIYDLFAFSENIAKMKPFGQGWPKPVFRFSLNLSQFYTQTIGKESQHIKLSSKIFPFDVLCWNSAKEFLSHQGGTATVFGELSVEEFRGVSRLTLKANDILFV